MIALDSRSLASMSLSDYGLLLETMKGSWKNGKGGWKTQDSL